MTGLFPTDAPIGDANKDRAIALVLNGADMSARLGQQLARLLGQGDVVLLSGPVGAGKSHLARALIRARLGETTEVPSPSFTLVQTYADPMDEDGPEIWHADLYRLSHPDEIIELGLESAFETAICLIEWPDRLGDLAPKGAVRLNLEYDSNEGRIARIVTADVALLSGILSGFSDMPEAVLQARPALPGQIDRLIARHRMLDRAGWARAKSTFLAGDASERSYDRLRRPMDGASAVLMDAPPDKGEDLAGFVAIAKWLRDQGLSAPKVLAQDQPQGYLLLEDLGDDLYARVLRDNPSQEPALYRAATQVLCHLQRGAAPVGLPCLGQADWATAAGFALDWYALAATGAVPSQSHSFTQCLTDLLARYADEKPVVILRDYHAENLLWLPERQGLARVGLLDFQLAQMGQPGYDLVSLIDDARREVGADAAQAARITFADAQGRTMDQLQASLAVLSAQRALRIIGVFARLSLVSGKTGYLPLLPRVWRHLQAALGHPALADLARICEAALPPPTPEILDRICAQASTRPAG